MYFPFSEGENQANHDRFGQIGISIPSQLKPSVIYDYIFDFKHVITFF